MGPASHRWPRPSYSPYLGIANLYPFNPHGVLEREYGYHNGALLYQHRKVERIVFSGDRFQRIFQLPEGQTENRSAFRIFVVGSSVAHRGNVPLPQRYFSKLQGSLKAPYALVLPGFLSNPRATAYLAMKFANILPPRTFG